jgi:predicted aminopeptidase
MNTQALIDRLMLLPQELMTLQHTIIDQTAKSQEVANSIVKAETSLRVLIANMTDDAGKKQYSNEDARKAAFAEMAEDDLDLNLLKKGSLALENALAMKRVEFECLSNEQRNIRAVLLFFSQNQEKS